MSINPIGPVPNRPTNEDLRDVDDIVGNFDYITTYIDSTLSPAINQTVGASFEDFLVPGVVKSTGFALTRNSSSQVTISAGTIWAVTGGGVLTRYVVDQTVIGAIPAATDERFDVIVFDTADGTVKRLPGTDTGGGVTLANRNGAPAVSSSRQELWNLVVKSTGLGAVQNTDFGDRRLPAAPVVKGLVAAGGASIVNGWGFKTVGAGVGDYTITFNRTLIRVPTITVTTTDLTSFDGGQAEVANVTADGFSIHLYNSADAFIDQKASFIADYS